MATPIPPTPKPGIPRHWDVELGGVRWLPRLIDKARMKSDGTLGAYLCGHSPVDQALLKRLNLTTDEFVAIVNGSATDDEVLDKLRARDFDYPSARRWSSRFHQTYRMFIPIWQLDEGYGEAKPWQRALIGAFQKIEGPVMKAFRKISPAP